MVDVVGYIIQKNLKRKESGILIPFLPQYTAGEERFKIEEEF